MDCWQCWRRFGTETLPGCGSVQLVFTPTQIPIADCVGVFTIYFEI